ncbi:MAG TPA: C4-type zinc ribbon domain-containing protein [Coriobacteriia bacterium]
MHLARALTELQEHDLAILRLERELEEMPEKRGILTARAKLADVERIRERTAEAIRAMDAVSKRLEDQIEALGVKMDAEQAKLVSGQIASPKELQSVAMELDALRRRVAGLEVQLLAEMQKRENGDAQLAKIDAALEAGHRTEATLTERFKEHGSSVLDRIGVEKRAKAALLASVEESMRTRYESLRETRHGIAVGTLDGSMCGACRVTLPAGKVAALEAGPDIGACPSCGRILIVRGE